MRDDTGAQAPPTAGQRSTRTTAGVVLGKAAGAAAARWRS